MDKLKPVAVQEIVTDMGIILRKISSVLIDHEKRLRMIESLDFGIEFDLVKPVIERISDEDKQTEALRAFKNFCNSIGISDLELTQA